MSENRESLIETPVWDLPVRLFHWSFAICFVVSWISGQAENRDVHYASGMILLGLVLFRVLWGLVGSPTARFAHFVRWPGAAVAYLRQSVTHDGPSYSFGHNPAGGLMVAALVALAGLQSLSGMASTDDVLFDGPLYGRLPNWLARPLEILHEPLANLLLALALLHIVVILVYRIAKGENLVRAMILGRARLPETVARSAEARGETKGAPLGRALLCAVIAAAVPAAIHVIY